jgi:general secretion pathway protein K
MKHRQRGVALITAVLMVALATMLAAEIGFKAYLNNRRALTVFALDQGYEIALGLEAMAAYGLMTSDAKQTHLAQVWNKPIRNLPLDGGGAFADVTADLEDVTGRFNLNLLAEPANPADPAQKKLQQESLDQFKRILSMAQLEPEWADKIVDWIDADVNESGASGAEDNFYTGQTPPYHTANRRITRVSEILALPEFGYERYRKLEPLVTALPADARINVCTASGIVLDSFSTNQRQYSQDAEWLLKQRANGCFPEKGVLLNGLTNPDERTYAEGVMSDTSSYFRATVVVTIGSNQFTLYSLLKREAGGVRPITRSFGTT